jgi:hypothetical protein
MPSYSWRNSAAAAQIGLNFGKPSCPFISLMARLIQRKKLYLRMSNVFNTTQEHSSDLWPLKIKPAKLYC